MEHNLENTVALLSRTPAALTALLNGLPEAWLLSNEGEGTWTVRDVIAHLIHGERNNWMPRVQWILEFGESKPFAPFQRDAFRDEPIELLLEEFAGLRAESLSRLRTLNLDSGHLKLRGLHPVFGPVTLSQQLATWAAHDLTHLHQISRILAHPYREAVGPWSKYLGVLHCTGHSAT
jgi:hypothetical protein